MYPLLKPRRASWRDILFAALAVTGAALPALAQPAPATGLPPLIDRELFFGDPEISGAQISPDGKFLAFIKPLDGTRNIWVKRTEEPFERARPVTADTKRPIPGFFWSRDSRAILFVQDQGGDENFNVYAVDPAGVPAAGAKVPAARNLTDAKGVRAFIYNVPKSDPDTIYVGLNDRDKAWHDLHQVKISTGERTMLRQNTERLTGWVFDTKDQLRLATRAAENGNTEVLRVDADGFKKVYECDVLESCGPVRFHKDGARVYMETNKGGVDLSRLVLFNPATGAEELVEADPENRVDFGNAIFSEVTDELIATTYLDDKQRFLWKNKAFEADYAWLKQQLPGSEISMGSSTADERLWVVSAFSDTEPGTTYLFDRQKKTLAKQYVVRDKLTRAWLASMQPIRYRSSDGLEVPAYLTLPKGVPAKGLPLIVFPHGGPWARDAWGYSGFPQFLANRGYAVLQPNFRGSTGFGKKYLDAGNGEWGQKMQDDITWGVKHLVAQGIADPKRVGIMGGSYGGYATLAGVAFTPDVYAAGVSIVGPSNLITLLDSIPPYWEPIRKLFHVRMGDPGTAEGKAQLVRQSPLTSAAKITTPLLVIQGANDPRVKQAESDQIVVALRDRGFPVEYIVAPDEGHGFARPVNNMAAYGAAEKFLAKHLGGRFQESMTPEVAARLTEITVDPKTVTLKKSTGLTVGVPTPAADLAPMTAKYAARIEMGGQKVAEMTLTTEVADREGTWVITDLMNSPMGQAMDTVRLQKGTLVPIARTVTQGPMAINYELKGGKATGQMKMGGDPKPIDVDLGGDVFADGAGAYEVLARLPLAEGYATAFRNFDIQTQKPKTMELRVAGSEPVTVAAGSFDAYKVEVSSPDSPQKSTFWVDKATRKVVKLVAVLPQMNGATLTSELQ
jgi:dipeptidyl aminopeptidase/acylaminoacyl peptidase